MCRQTLVSEVLLGLPLALLTVLPVRSAPTGPQGTWQVEIESRTDSTNPGQIHYRLIAQQTLAQSPTRPVQTASAETLTYSSMSGAAPRTVIIKYLSRVAVFRAPDLTCDGVTVGLLPPGDTRGVAAAPVITFRQDFRGAGFSFGIKVPRGYHSVAGSVHSSRVSGLLPTQKPRAFVKPPQYGPHAEKDFPHLLSVLLPAPAPRAIGTGYEAPYGIEFDLAPD